jgi:hypothetical protein
LAIAALEIGGLNLESAARWVSLLAMAATAALLSWGLIFLGVPLFARQALLCLFIVNAATLTYATAVQSEFLFCAIATAAVLSLIRTAALDPTAPGAFLRAAVPFVLAALGYVARYAGLLLLVPVSCCALLSLWNRRQRTPPWFFLLPAIPFVPFLILSFRNWKLTGTWRGGNEVPTYTPPLQVAADYFRAHLHLFWGEHAVRLGVWEGLVLLALLGLAGLAFAARKSSSAWSGLEQTAWLWLMICAGFYSAVMCYLGVRVTISFGTRMFQPMLPLYLCMAGLALSWLARSQPGIAWKILLSLLVVGSIGTNVRDFYAPLPPELDHVLADFYSKSLPSGETLAHWVESSVPPSQTILAADGQATGFLLHRSTVSLLEAHYSTVRWNCTTILDTLRQFRARYVFLYQPNVDPYLRLDSESDFVRSSLAGQPPCGFRIAAQTPDITILSGPE